MLLIVEKTCSKLLSYFKMRISIALSTSIVLSNHLYYLRLQVFRRPKKKLVPVKPSLPFPTAYQP